MGAEIILRAAACAIIQIDRLLFIIPANALRIIAATLFAEHIEQFKPFCVRQLVQEVFDSFHCVSHSECSFSQV